VSSLNDIDVPLLTCDDREMPICVFTAFSSIIYNITKSILLDSIKLLQVPQLHYLTCRKSATVNMFNVSLIDKELHQSKNGPNP